MAIIAKFRKKCGGCTIISTRIAVNRIDQTDYINVIQNTDYRNIMQITDYRNIVQITNYRNIIRL